MNFLTHIFGWAEIGVILGARLGYIIFYDPQTMYYLSHPWQIFNPFFNGEFVGISGDELSWSFYWVFNSFFIVL